MNEKTTIIELIPKPQYLRQNIISIQKAHTDQYRILTELTQNAIDAIRKRYKTINPAEQQQWQGKIDIYIDCRTKSIKVVDNGIGIEHDLVANVIQANSTQKDNDKDALGSKGVGMTFCLFQASEPKITTRHYKSEFGTETTLEDPVGWKNNIAIDYFPKIHHTTGKSSLEIGTTIELNNLQDNKSGDEVYKNTMYFEWGQKELEFVLRTKTPVGYTDGENCLDIKGYDKPFDKIDIFLHTIAIDSSQINKYIPFKYLTIEEVIKTKYKAPNNHGIIEENNYSTTLFRYNSETKARQNEGLRDLTCIELSEAMSILQGIWKDVKSEDVENTDPRILAQMDRVKTSIIVYKYNPDNELKKGDRMVDYAFYSTLCPSSYNYKDISNKYLEKWQFDRQEESDALDGFEANFTIADRGYPMDISVPKPTNVGASGYLNNVFVIVKVDNAPFDNSKKYLINKEFEKKIQNDVYKIAYSQLIMVNDYIAKIEKYQKKEEKSIYNEEDKINPQNLNPFKFIKIPTSGMDVSMFYMGLIHLVNEANIKIIQQITNSNSGYASTRVSNPFFTTFENSLSTKYLEWNEVDDIDKPQIQLEIDTLFTNFPFVVFCDSVEKLKITGTNYKNIKKNGFIVVWDIFLEKTWLSGATGEVYDIVSIDTVTGVIHNSLLQFGCKHALVCKTKSNIIIPLLILKNYCQK